KGGARNYGQGHFYSDNLVRDATYAQRRLTRAEGVPAADVPRAAESIARRGGEFEMTNYLITANPNPVNENGGSITFTITRSGSFPAETLFASTVQGSSNGYSTNSGDYSGVANQQVVFAANQTTAQVTIAVTNDSIPESDETFGFIVQRNSSDPLTTHL